MSQNFDKMEYSEQQKNQEKNINEMRFWPSAANYSTEMTHNFLLLKQIQLELNEMKYLIFDINNRLKNLEIPKKTKQIIEFSENPFIFAAVGMKYHDDYKFNEIDQIKLQLDNNYNSTIRVIANGNHVADVSKHYSRKVAILIKNNPNYYVKFVRAMTNSARLAITFLVEVS
jgi:hypothetical protein